MWVALATRHLRATPTTGGGPSRGFFFLALQQSLLLLLALALQLLLALRLQLLQLLLLLPSCCAW